MNDEDGRIRYGKYTLDLYFGPIYCEDWAEGDKADGQITFTLGKVEEEVKEVHIAAKDEINAIKEKELQKRTPSGLSNIGTPLGKQSTLGKQSPDL